MPGVGAGKAAQLARCIDGNQERRALLHIGDIFALEFLGTQVILESGRGVGDIPVVQLRHGSGVLRRGIPQGDGVFSGPLGGKGFLFGFWQLFQGGFPAQGGAFVPGSNEKQANLRHALNEAETKLQGQKQQQQPSRPAPTRAIRVGDTVELLKLGTKATVLALNKDGTYQLQAGIMKVNAKPDEVYLLENETKTKAKKIIEGKVRELKAAAQPELDLRGMAADEAIILLDNFLDSAYMGNLPTARIIHGKGTGVLRAAVHDELRRCKYVKSFRLGVYGEGESGVTIVEFK